MKNEDLASFIRKEFFGKKITKVMKSDDYVISLIFEDKKSIIFTVHPLLVGFSFANKELPEFGSLQVLKDGLNGFHLYDCQKIEKEPIYKFYFKWFSNRILIFEGLKRCANILLLDENETILWALRTFKGEFRQGNISEKWSPPPQKDCKEDFQIHKEFDEIYFYLLERYKTKEKRKLKSKHNTLFKKIEILKKELEEGKKFIEFELIGKALLNLKEIHKRGEKKATILNYSFFPPKEISINLDPKLSIYENAQKFFKLAKKGRERIKLIPKRIEEAKKEVEMVTNKIKEIEKIDLIENILKITNPKEEKTKEIRKKKVFKDVIEIDLPLGFKGYAGKNARGNEIVSFQIANGEDFWFHASDYNGAHLIVRNVKKEEELPFEVERFALKYVAQHSSAPTGNVVEVIETKAKYLARVKGKVGTVYVAKSKKRKIDLNKNE